MSRPVHSPPTTTIPSDGAATWLGGMILLVLVVVAALRPLIVESYDPAGSPFSVSIPEITEPTPVRTLVLNLCIVAGFLLCSVLRAATGRRHVRTGLEVGLGLLILAAVVSSATAGNKRLAINGSIDGLCGVLLAVTLAQVVTRPWHRAILIAAVVGSAAAQAVQCADQYFFTFPETLRLYEADRESFWAAQGVELDSSRVELFERRMAAREAGGFLAHTNVTGSYLALCGLVAGGVALRGWQGLLGGNRAMSDVLTAVGATLVAALILGAITLTGSRGAVLSVVVGLAFAATSRFLRPWIAANQGMSFAIAWVAIAAGLAMATLYGAIRDSLPGASLQFRWEYWTASSRMIAEHGRTGVGRENFGRHYLQYKSIASPEEVSNPHNLLVQATAEWGALGLAGVAAMLLGGSWVFFQNQFRGRSNHFKSADQVGREAPGVHVSPGPTACHSEASRIPGRAYAAMVSIGTAVVVAGERLLGSEDSSFRLLFRVMVGAPWIIAAMVAVAAIRKGDTLRPIKNDVSAFPGTLAGLVAFLVHELINFALFVPATATTLFALAACCFRTDEPESPRIRSKSLVSPAVSIAAAFAAFVTVVCLGLLPAMRTQDALAGLRSASSEALNEDTLRFVAAADPYDPTPLVLFARLKTADAFAASEFDAAGFRLGLEALNLAVGRDPFSVGLHRLRTSVLLEFAKRTASPTEVAAAVESAKKVVALYPSDPHGRVMLADTLLQAAKLLKSPEYAQEATMAYRDGLALDDLRPAWETIRRFRDRERNEIQRKVLDAEEHASPN
jgi:hypothetical protein